MAEITFGMIKRRLASREAMFLRVFSTVAKLRVSEDDFRGVAVRLTKAASESRWDLVRRIMRDLKITGICEHCGINLYGVKSSPSGDSMPCNVPGCPFEAQEKQKPLTFADINAIEGMRK